MAVVSIQRAETFVTIECCNCGTVFAVSSLLQTNWRETKQSFYCPNGHPQSYTESETQRVKREMQKQIDAANAMTAAAKRDVEWWRVRDSEKKRRLIAAKGQMTKLKNRISHGVCPCCHRTFKQLQAHMATKHPDYRSDEATADDAVAGAD